MDPHFILLSGRNHKRAVHAIKTLPKVCHYLDIPIQHGSDGILKRMGRRTNSKELRDMAGMAKDVIAFSGYCT